LIYILLEHKSYIDRWVLFQLLGYIVQIGERERMVNKAKRKKKRQENKKNNRPENEGIETEYLTPVIPIIVYHGLKKWEFPDHLSNLYQCHSQYKKLIPDFAYEVIDLTKYEDYQIKGIVYLRVAALVMKYYFRKDLNHKLPEILSLLSDLIQQKTTLNFLEVVLEYIGTNKNIDEKAMIVNLEKAFDKKGNEIMHSVADKWINRGIIEGEKRGIIEGEKRGEKKGKIEILSDFSTMFFIPQNSLHLSAKKIHKIY